jgi:hypothetical protein
MIDAFNLPLRFDAKVNGCLISDEDLARKLPAAFFRIGRLA